MDTDRPHPLVRALRPVQRFARVEAAGGAVLLVATVVAVVWANSGWRSGYADLFGTRVAGHDLTHWIDDGLMAVFFLVVGVEVKQELVTGELRDRRAAVLPVLAALGGMVVPALLYAALVAGGAGGRGWGIPMATDIAFALGVVALLGPRVPPSLKVFLLTLAVVDDIGAIVVIAVFYADGLSWPWLAAAAAVVVAVVGARRAGLRSLPAFVVLGALLWLCCYRSGVHATIAGVVMGLLAPARPSAAHGEQVAPTERVARALHPWTAFLVVPLFALGNAGVEVSAGALTSPSATTVGVVVGLVVGKVVGISLFSWLAVRVGVGVLPPGVRWGQLVGVAALGGIGFTVALFVAGLAFPAGAPLAADAKVGVLAASVVAAVVGSSILAVASRRPPQRVR